MTSGTPVAVFPPAVIVGRFAWVVKIVVPPFLTSTMTEEPAGAVPTLARTVEMVMEAPVSL
jgi:hypothetical protein